MNERATVDLINGFRNPAGPAPPAPSPARRTTPRDVLTLRDLRIAVAAADFVQTIAVSVGVHAVVSGVELASWKALGVGVLVAAIAAALRRGLRRAGAPNKSSALPASRLAALATATSICAAGTICWLIAPRATTEFILTWFVSWAMLSSTLSAAFQVGGVHVRKRVFGPLRVVVVGRPADAARIMQPSTAADAGHWRVAGHVDTKQPDWLDRLHVLVARGDVDVVALALASRHVGAWVASVCSRLADQPVRVCLVIEAAAPGRTPRTMERLGDAALIDLLADPHGGLEGGAKRATDIALSALALVALSPLFALLAAAVRLESPGPVLFRQERFGLGGRHIRVLKFRSMRAEAGDASGENRTVPRDPRVTRVGRILRHLSFDELPQLVNVLRGDMSLVGPRPHPLHMRVGELYYFDAVERYRARHLVKPGITGWAQVNGSRGAVDTIEKAQRRVELDLWYLENWSIWLDCQIIMRTALGGFLSEGFN